jgi:hypothetical protein
MHEPQGRIMDITKPDSCGVEICHEVALLSSNRSSICSVEKFQFYMN